MANYKIVFTRSAQKTLERLPKAAVAKILAAISGLGFDPYPLGCRKLSGFVQTFRIRIQDYRVIYEILDHEILIKILKIGHRKDVYRL